MLFLLEEKLRPQFYLLTVERNNVAVVQSLTHVWLFATPCTAAGQASLSFTVSWSLLKLLSIELVMSSNHLILCRPFLLLLSVFPSIRVFPVSWLFASGGQSIAPSSSSTSVLPMNIQGWFPLGLTSQLSLLLSLSSRYSQEIFLFKREK